MINIKLPKLPGMEKKFKKKTVLPNPNTYWMAIFFLSLALILVAFIFSFYLFTKINREEALPREGEKERLQKINPDRINKAIQVFEQREKTSDSIINSPAPVVDPSL